MVPNISPFNSPVWPLQEADGPWRMTLSYYHYQCTQVVAPIVVLDIQSLRKQIIMALSAAMWYSFGEFILFLLFIYYQKRGLKTVHIYMQWVIIHIYSFVPELYHLFCSSSFYSTKKLNHLAIPPQPHIDPP